VRVALLRRAILSLPTHYREAIVLCDVHGLPYDEAAAIVGCPVGTIRSRLSRARRLLAERCRASPDLSDSHEARLPVSWLLSRRPKTVGSE
jgi:DNA-directed RNA polymerase specialized sigma24 family protein